MYPQLLWLGLLALMIPILIHLFSQSRTRLVKFSLVGLIIPTKVQQITQLRLTERLLLIFRLGLLLLAALLLAQFTWPSDSDTPKPPVIITQDWLAHASNAQKQAVADHLHEDKLSYLDPGDPFHSQTFTAERLLTGQETTAQKSTRSNLWLGLSHYAQELNKDSEITVYSTDRLPQFSGQRLPMIQSLNWHFLHVASEPLPDMTLKVLVLYEPQQQTSVAYLRGAFNALDHQPGWTIEIVYRQQGTLPLDKSVLTNLDWVLYLSATPLNAVLLDYVHHGGKVLLSAAEAENSGHWRAHKTDIDASITVTQLGSPALPRSFFAALAKDKLWQTQDNQDLVNQYDVGQGQILAWHSRFDPKWNNLVTQLDFPVILNDLLNRTRAEQVELANGRLSPEQIRHSLGQDSHVSPARLARGQATHKDADWTHLLLALLVIVFCTERLLAERSVVMTTKKNRLAAK